MISDSMNLEEYLQGNKIWHKFVDKPETIHTQDAAKESGIDLQKITKSLVLLDQDKNCIMTIIPGNCKLSFEKVKSATNAKKVRLVPFEEAENYSGYLPGATPMIYHKTKMIILLDKKLLEYDTIFGGGGTRTKLLELKTNDVVSLNNAKVEDLSE